MLESISGAPNWRVLSRIYILAIIGAVFIIVSTSRYGAGVSPDSVDYIATARNLIKGAGFTNYDGSPTVMWPPLYPALLALTGGISGIDPARVAQVLNALVFGLIVYVGGVLTHKHISYTSLFAFLGTLALLSSSTLFDVSVMAWTEPIFILWVLLSLILIDTYLVKRDIPSLTLLSTAISLASLTRYLGVTLILWGGLIILLFSLNSLKNKIIHLALFTIIAALPLGLWLFRNYAISGTLFGDRASSTFTLSQNISLMFNSLMDWYVPTKFIGRSYILLITGLGAGFLTGISLITHWQSWKAKLRHASPIILFVVIYAGFLLITTTVSANDQIGSRLLSPVFVPLTLLLLIFILSLAETYTKRLSKNILNSILLLSLGIWLIYPIRSTIRSAIRLFPSGQGYASKAWLGSETVQYLLQHPVLTSGCSFYTNDPRAAYYLAHLATDRSPAKTRYNSTDVVSEISSLRGSWPVKNNACLVWFEVITRPWLFTVPELQNVANFGLIAKLDDGVIYTISRK
jgi:hypothetical protein